MIYLNNPEIELDNELQWVEMTMSDEEQEVHVRLSIDHFEELLRSIVSEHNKRAKAMVNFYGDDSKLIEIVYKK